MIDPMVSLAFAVYSNKGVYATLLGSGVSRASGIPTGWDVILDLIRKVAKIVGEDCEPDPAEWYRKKYEIEPNYGQLLDSIAKTSSERQQLLRSYFEPTEDERSQGIKCPSKAHKHIAQLVAKGYLRVIITTNFDRLTEKALEDIGITPTVVSTVDQIGGARPLAHSEITIIKLHGDYLDTRIKNTESELDKYDKPLAELLDRILDEYGLIIAGWSGEWDTALCAAIERCPNCRFTTFWTTKSSLKGKAKRLIKCRRAAVIQIKDADDFFGNLFEKVQALDDLAAPHPLSARMAAATVKRYLVDPSARIRLRDIVHEETERLFVETNTKIFDGQERHQPASEEIKWRVEKYNALCETLLSILAVGCYWGDKEASKLWVASLQRIANPLENVGGLVNLLQLRHYPSLLLLYGAGVASIASGNYETLSAILTKPNARDFHHKPRPICSVIHAGVMDSDDLMKAIPDFARFYRPTSGYLFKILRDKLREFLPRDEDYQDAFDRFEYLLGLIHADLNHRDWPPTIYQPNKNLKMGWWGPNGLFVFRNSCQGENIKKLIEAEIEADGNNWPLLKTGLFGGSLAQLKTAKEKYDVFLSYVFS